MIGAKPIFIAPNKDPEYFCPKLKVLTLLYDQISVCHPDLFNLERYYFCVDDFLEACSGAYPAIVPLGREAWFDHTQRRRRPEWYPNEGWDSTFDLRVRDFCRNRNFLLGSDSYEISWYKLREAWKVPEKRLLIESTSRRIMATLPSLALRTAEMNAERLQQPIEWAAMDLFSQIETIKSHVEKVSHISLTSDFDAVIARREHVVAYAAISNINTTGQTGRSILKGASISGEMGRLLLQKDRFAGGDNIVDFLNEAYNIPHMSWREMKHLRSWRRNPNIIQYILLLAKYLDEMERGTPISSLVEKRAKKLIEKCATMIDRIIASVTKLTLKHFVGGDIARPISGLLSFSVLGKYRARLVYLARFMSLPKQEREILMISFAKKITAAKGIKI